MLVFEKHSYFSFFYRLAFAMCTKDLNTPVRKIRTFCGTDCFLATGGNAAVRCSTLCRVTTVIGGGCGKDLHGQSGVIFPACSLEIGPRDRTYTERGEARPKPLLWFQREKCLSSNLILPKCFIMCVFLNFLLELKASRIF